MIEFTLFLSNFLGTEAPTFNRIAVNFDFTKCKVLFVLDNRDLVTHISVTIDHILRLGIVVSNLATKLIINVNLLQVALISCNLHPQRIKIETIKISKKLFTVIFLIPKVVDLYTFLRVKSNLQI